MRQVARRVKQREAVHHVPAARAAKHDAPAGVGWGGVLGGFWVGFGWGGVG